MSLNQNLAITHTNHVRIEVVLRHVNMRHLENIVAERPLRFIDDKYANNLPSLSFSDASAKENTNPIGMFYRIAKIYILPEF